MVRTVNEVYLDLRQELRDAGVAGYQIEARELVCYAMDIQPEEFLFKKQLWVFDEMQARIAELKAQRLSGTPLQHITGRWEFYGIPLEVSRDTLIPRADTETLAETAITLLESRSRSRMLDLCCGSGCLAIAVLKNVEGVTAVLGDLSEAALEVAQRNLITHHLTGRALTAVLDAKAVPPAALGRFHLIVCNPPYIPSREIPTLDVEVQNEPHMALDGGEDGLDFYRAVATGYFDSLNQGGVLAFEVGLGQFEDVSGILEEAGYKNVQVRNDLTGIERVVLGMRRDDE